MKPNLTRWILERWIMSGAPENKDWLLDTLEASTADISDVFPEDTSLLALVYQSRRNEKRGQLISNH